MKILISGRFDPPRGPMRYFRFFSHVNADRDGKFRVTISQIEDALGIEFPPHTRVTLF